MSKLKSYLLLLSALCICKFIYAQTLHEIHIGDTIPDIEIHSIMNYKSDSSRISSFRGKGLILDFWATWCSSCLGSFPKLDSLQRHFKGQLQILLVNTKSTGDNQGSIKHFFEIRKKNGIEFILPSVAEDTLLNILFPHKTIPHCVWIDQYGVVKAITSSEEVNTDNIYKLITNTSLNLPLKKDLLDFNKNEPLFINNNGGSGQNIKYRSLISGPVAGLPTMTGINKVKNSHLAYRIFCINAGILLLYRIAYPKITYYPANRIILEVKSLYKFKYDQKMNMDTWKENNTYCYELDIPPTPEEQAREIMQHDLNRFFNLKATFEKRWVNCLVVTSNDDIPKPISKGGKPGDNLREDDNGMKYMQNEPISVLIDNLNEMIPTPVFDETKCNQHLDIELPRNFTNITTLQKALKKYGFNLVYVKKQLDMFVLTEEHKEQISNN